MGLYEFGPFTLDPDRRVLTRNGDVLALPPKTFDLLLMLVQRPGHAFSKRELMTALWPDTFVEEANLSFQLSLLRKALGAEAAQFVETVPKHGYRFSTQVRTIPTRDVPSAERLAPQTQPVGQAFALEALSGTASVPASANVSKSRRSWRRAILTTVVLLATAILPASLVWMRSGAAEQPVFQRLTYRRGTMFNARFAPDGQTIVYSASWEGNPYRFFSTRIGSTESRDLDLPEGDLLSISSTGELAIVLGGARGPFNHGTLARVPLAGGAPREVLEYVRAADWAPHGDALAVSRTVDGTHTLEFPVGNVLLRPAGPVNAIAFSPDGDQIALVTDAAVATQPIADSVPGFSLQVLDLKGSTTTLSSGWRAISGLAWSPSRDEVWFSGTRGQEPPTIHVLTLDGKSRVVERVPGALILQDVAANGHVLVTSVAGKGGIIFQPPDNQAERDLSWLDWSVPMNLSPDGKTILFNETRQGGGPAGSIYIRGTDGSPAVRLGEGNGWEISPDGKWVLATDRRHPDRIFLLPTKAGETRTIPCGKVHCGGGTWFPDGNRVLVWGSEPDRRGRNWVLDLQGGKPRAISPEGTDGGVLSPDGKFLANRGYDFRVILYPIDGGQPRELPAQTYRHMPVGWTADGRALYLHNPAAPRRPDGTRAVRIYRFELASSRMELWKEIVPSDRAGLLGLLPIRITPDGASYAYGYHRHLNELYVAEGLR
jgi:DNA-binding winged helix-turn-helix (wHTH) protein/Tol biopolymer transport system component